MTTKTTGPAAPKMRLGQELRAIREGAQPPRLIEDAARACGWHPSKLSRIEGGKQGISLGDLRELLDHYGMTNPQKREQLQDLARAGKQRGWWTPYNGIIAAPYSTYVGLESDATALSGYEAHIVHGLLQTREYAQAVIGRGEPLDGRTEVNAKVKLRIERQARLLQPEHPLKLNMVFDESVLRRRIGGPDVMQRQLEHLIKMAERPGISIRVIPHSAGVYQGMFSSFTLLHFGEDQPDIVYVESVAGDTFPPADDLPRYARAFDTLFAVAEDQSMSIGMMEAAIVDHGRTQ